MSSCDELYAKELEENESMFYDVKDGGKKITEKTEQRDAEQNIYAA
jgi:hypothetical protein